MLLPIYIMWWQVLLPIGRCYSHCRVGDGTVADVIATGLMLLPWDLRKPGLVSGESLSPA